MAEFGHLSQVMPRLATVVMSIDLVPIRKFAYIFDRRHFGMIGTVTQRDTSLELGNELEGQPFERGHKTSREGVFLSGVKGMTGGTGPPAMLVPCVQGLDFPRSVTPVLESAARACTGRI